MLNLKSFSLIKGYCPCVLLVYVQEHYEVHYIVLRASKEETMKRAIERSKLDRETNIELVETMWKQFSNLGIYELNVIDTTTHSIKDTVSAVKEKIVSGTALLF